MAALSTTAMGSRGRLASLPEIAARPELQDLGIEAWSR
jgi:hypothetical protein